LEARNINIKEKMPASKKLQAADSADLLADASTLIALKGKKVQKFSVKSSISDEAIAATLGPTGNMRAPTMRVGKTIIVGFNEAVYAEFFG